MRRTPIACSSSIVALTCAMCAGCGLRVGSHVLVPASNAEAMAAHTLGYAISPNGTEGVVLAGTVTAAAPQSGSGREARGWASLLVGFGSSPDPGGSRAGIEILGGPAIGRLPDRGSSAASLGWSSELAVPIRVSANRPSWSLDTHSVTYHMLAPGVQVTQLFPLGSDHDHSLVTTFLFGLTYRMGNWVTTAP